MPTAPAIDIASRLEGEAEFWKKHPDDAEAKFGALRDNSLEVEQRLRQRRATAFLLAASATIAAAVIGDVSMKTDKGERQILQRALLRLDVRDQVLLRRIAESRAEMAALCPDAAKWTDDEIIISAKRDLQMEMDREGVEAMLREAQAAAS